VTGEAGARMNSCPAPREFLTLHGAGHPSQVQADSGGFHNGNSAKPILFEVLRQHDREAVDRPIREPEPDRVSGFCRARGFEGSPATGSRA
jgi:hypothetical protein